MGIAVVGTLMAIVTVQVVDLANQLPEYRETIHAKLQVLAGHGGGTLGRVADHLEQIGEDVLAAAGTPGPGQKDAPAPPPVHLVVTPQESSWAALRDAVHPLIAPVASTLIVIVFVFFMLMRREDLRDRIIRLIGAARLNTTIQAIDDASTRVSRYLRTQLIINSGFGALAAIGLWLIGVPNAFLWGALAIPL